MGGLAIAIVAACGEGPAEPCPEPDRDGDGHDDVACGGDDCDDDDGAVHPGAQDAAGWTRRTVAAGEHFDPSIAFDAANVAWLAFRDPEGAMVVTSSGDLDCDGR